MQLSPGILILSLVGFSLLQSHTGLLSVHIFVAFDNSVLVNLSKNIHRGGHLSLFLTVLYQNTFTVIRKIIPKLGNKAKR